MPTPQELETKFWQALKSDMTMMVGLDGVEDGHARPMTAQVDGAQGPIWFFTAKDTEIAIDGGGFDGLQFLLALSSYFDHLRCLPFLAVLAEGGCVDGGDR